MFPSSAGSLVPGRTELYQANQRLQITKSGTTSSAKGSGDSLRLRSLTVVPCPPYRAKLTPIACRKIFEGGEHEKCARCPLGVERGAVGPWKYCKTKVWHFGGHTARRVSVERGAARRAEAMEVRKILRDQMKR
jgi:hypothetical protein